MKTFEKKSNGTVSPVHRGRIPVLPSFNPAAQIQRAQIRQVLRPPRVQGKLTIGQLNDKYEQEADYVADEVMRMPGPRVQRQVEPEEEEEEELVQTKPIGEQITPLIHRQVEEEKEEEILQTKENPGQIPEVASDLESRIHALEGGGQPLPKSVRNFLEPRFGYDFGRVRIHSNSEAAKMARALNASAFTMGQNIVLGAGQYTSKTTAGQRLLSHELTHVVQQHKMDSAAPRAVLMYVKPNSVMLQRKPQVEKQATGNVPVSSTTKLPEKKKAGVGSKPRLLATGRKAAEELAKWLPKGLSADVLAGGYGWIRLQPGLIYMGDRMVVSATGATVTYTVRDKLYITSTPQFVHDEWILSMSKGAKSALGMVYLTELEIALLIGIFVPWYVLLGMTVAKAGLFYRENKKLMDKVLAHSSDLLPLLWWFITNHPKLFGKLIWEGIEGEDVAFFIGRVIRGSGGLTKVTLKSLLRVAGVTLVIVTAIHAWPAAARGGKEIGTAAAEDLAKVAKKLKKAMEEANVTLSDEEALEIIKDMIADPAVLRKLKSLEGTLDELIPALGKLEEALRPWAGATE